MRRRAKPVVHLHVHITVPGLADVSDRLSELANEVRQLKGISMEEVQAIAEVTEAVQDLSGDVDALLATVEAGIKEISPEGQEALDALKSLVVGLNTRVGDRDGSEATPE